MGRFIAAGVLGAVVYYIWGMLAWLVVPLHDPTISGLPAEGAIVEAFKAQEIESGVYVTPFPTDKAAMSNPDSEFSKKHRAGPIFTIYYQKEGAESMSSGVMGMGFVIDLMGSLLAVCLLSSVGPCGNSYWCRVGFVAGLGVFVAIMGHLSYWNWMHFPLGYTLAFMVDVTVGWTLAGLAIAALVRPQGVPLQTALDSQPANRAQSPNRDSQKREPKPAQPQAPVRNDAITLLATLQREARFVDIVQEPLGDYSDAQIGAAARDVLRDCATVLDRLFQLAPIVEGEEGSAIEIPTDADSARFRITGNSTESTMSAALVHHGWQAKRCELPKWSGSKDSALVVSPVELEVK